MSPTDSCPDCGGSLDRMRVSGSDAVGELTVVAGADEETFLSSIRADEILTPVPFVCSDCRRIVWYAEE